MGNGVLLRVILSAILIMLGGLLLKLYMTKELSISNLTWDILFIAIIWVVIYIKVEHAERVAYNTRYEII